MNDKKAAFFLYLNPIKVFLYDRIYQLTTFVEEIEVGFLQYGFLLTWISFCTEVEGYMLHIRFRSILKK